MKGAYRRIGFGKEKDHVIVKRGKEERMKDDANAFKMKKGKKRELMLNGCSLLNKVGAEVLS